MKRKYDLAIGNFSTLAEELHGEIASWLDKDELNAWMQTCSFFSAHPKLLRKKALMLMSITANDIQSFLIYKGNLFACGWNGDDQFGLGHNKNQRSFAAINNEALKQAGGVKQVAAGINHTMLLCHNGILLARGENQFGQLGLSRSKCQNTFVVVNNDPFKQAGGVKQVAVGNYHTVLLCNDETLFVAGNNEYGQLGLGHRKNQNTFVVVNNDVIRKAGGVKQVIASGYHTIVLCHNRTFFVSGLNGLRRLGLGHKVNQKTFIVVDNDAIKQHGGVKHVAASEFHTIILCNDGTILVSGHNESGQLGLGHKQHQDTIVVVNNDAIRKAGGVKQVAAGDCFTMVLGCDGTLFATGSNVYGQLGLAHKQNQNTFVVVNNDAIRKAGGVKQLAVGYYHVIITCNNGMIFTCGRNTFGELGLNDIGYYNQLTCCLQSPEALIRPINNEVVPVVLPQNPSEEPPEAGGYNIL